MLTSISKPVFGLMTLAGIGPLIFREYHRKNQRITMADLEKGAAMLSPLARGRLSIQTIVKWEEVGGLLSLKKDLEKYIVYPIKALKDNQDFWIDLRTGIFQYGSPGCGKTLIAKAVANKVGANCILFKGLRMLYEVYKDLKSALRKMFDEVDVFCMKSGEKGGHVMEQLFSQLLLELEKLEDAQGVYVITATDIPDLLDPALLTRKGFHKILHVPLPSPEERGLILTTIGPIKPSVWENDFWIDLRTGIFQYGPPGCGKMVISKAVANKAGANFILFKGLGMLYEVDKDLKSALRKMFDEARSCTPCILFFDHVDVFCMKSGEKGGYVMEQLFNQLLLELEKLEEAHDVYVIGATVRLDLLDPALLTRKRFHKILHVPLPSSEERGLILKAIGPITPSV